MKKQEKSVVSRSNAESEYWAIANVILELIWIRDWFLPECPMRLYGDNKAAIHIAENVVFHENQTH